MLEIKNLKKVYNNKTVVDIEEMNIKKGDIIGVLGPNGAGKSTTISMIATLLKPTEGSINYKNEDIIKNPKIIRESLGLVPQELSLYEELTGYDNLKFWGSAYHVEDLDKKIEEISNMIGLKSKLTEKVSTYSGGMKRRLNIGVSLLHNPELLIMDEPTVGIDPQSRNHILETVKKLNKAGSTIIYTSHYIDEVEFLCDYIYIMDGGRILLKGYKEDILSKEKIRVDYKNISEEIIYALEHHFNDITVVNNSVYIEKKDHVYNDIIKISTNLNAEIISIENLKTNLETLFLEITGKELRD